MLFRVLAFHTYREQCQCLTGSCHGHGDQVGYAIVWWAAASRCPARPPRHGGRAVTVAGPGIDQKFDLSGSAASPARPGTASPAVAGPGIDENFDLGLIRLFGTWHDREKIDWKLFPFILFFFPMAYQPVTEEDRQWASAENPQPLFRGPCGPFFNWLDRMSNIVQEQPIARNALLFGIVLVGMFMMNMLLDDEHVAVLSSGAKVCADKADYFEKVNHRCQVRNKFALAFLNGAQWVKCAEFTRGATLLEASADSKGVRWYDIDDKSKVGHYHDRRPA
jgi:hypothetical protein